MLDLSRNITSAGLSGERRLSISDCGVRLCLKRIFELAKRAPQGQGRFTGESLDPEKCELVLVCIRVWLWLVYCRARFGFVARDFGSPSLILFSTIRQVVSFKIIISFPRRNKFIVDITRYRYVA